ncbi:hypothetical protein SLEP1_g22149 [Rubroshorea leprosula]|uniref:Uncharacterized protein n=1 Tax=Rubroshorea leprosula TaxID=152421 RepID=A0AAV5J8A4_9ROSI|nr:hypothetical protein SLEP1_g22149 [Rubroshorea leprosula]
MPWKIGKEAWNFSFFLVQEPDFEPRNLPPLLENPDLLCSVRWLLLLWGQIALNFRSCEFLPCTAAGFFPLLGPVSTVGKLCTCRHVSERAGSFNPASGGYTPANRGPASGDYTLAVTYRGDVYFVPVLYLFS